jgi:hypothetical protein
MSELPVIKSAFILGQVQSDATTTTVDTGKDVANDKDFLLEQPSEPPTIVPTNTDEYSATTDDPVMKQNHTDDVPLSFPQRVSGTVSVVSLPPVANSL